MFIKFKVLRDVVLCSHVEVDWHFRGAYCLHHQGDEGGIEAVHTSEMSVNFNVTTQRYIPKDSEIYTRCRENLKSHNMFIKYRPHFRT
jgi:hypothetical protein